MESTRMLQAIEELKQHYGPRSHIEIARDSVLARLASINKVEMPPILDDKQRRIFASKIELLEGFLRSDNGADAIEMLVDAFECYCEEVESKKDNEDDDDSA